MDFEDTYIEQGKTFVDRRTDELAELRESLNTIQHNIAENIQIITLYGDERHIYWDPETSEDLLKSHTQAYLLRLYIAPETGNWIVCGLPEGDTVGHFGVFDPESEVFKIYTMAELNHEFGDEVLIDMVATFKSTEADRQSVQNLKHN